MIYPTSFRLFIVLIVFFTLFGCNKKQTSTASVKLYNTTDLKKSEFTKVKIITKNKEQFTIKAEIADTFEKRMKGLMFRKHLASDAGMLFLMPKQEIQYFYMKNTLIPLDMIFINQKQEIVGIARNTTPLNEDNVFVNAPSKYVLEVNAHFCKQHEINKGDRIIFSK